MDIHFNGYKVKYTILNHTMRPVVQSQKIKTIAIFINLDDLFHTLHRPLVNQEFQVCGKDAAKQLVSNVMNLIGHYRNWALKEGMTPTVCAVYTSSHKRFKNMLYLPSYRKHFLDMMDESNGDHYFINDAIQNSYRIFHVVAKYIPHVYVIDSKYLEPSILPLYLSKSDCKADWNILISRDSYDLQYSYRDKWSVISPKGDNTTFVNRQNIWNYLNVKERIYKEECDLRFTYELYPFAKALVGDRYRSIPRLKSVGWKTLFNYLQIVNEGADPDKLVVLQKQRFLDLVEKKKVNEADMNHNLYCIDAESQVEAMMDTDETVIQVQLEDMEDFDGLSEMNQSIFREFPLNLNFLCNRTEKPSTLIW